MSPERIIVVGAGGHAKVVLESIRAAGEFAPAGLLDPKPSADNLFGVPVLGDDDLLEKLKWEGIGAVVIALGENTLRQQLGDRVRALGFSLPVISHPSALIAPSARIGAGSLIMARAVIGTDTGVEDFAIVNTGAVVDHENQIGTAAHVATGCALAGMVRVGARALLGVGTAVRPRVTIGSDAVIGAGSAVIADVPAGAWVAGTPARPLPRQGRR